MTPKLSLVIPCLSLNDPKLKELLASIDRQDFPKSEMEVLVITEGTSESAKAIGIRRAKGYVIGILASDNEFIRNNELQRYHDMAIMEGASQSCYYYYTKNDNILNRYFALFGFNDPLSFYMGKCDRLCRVETIGNFDIQENATIGDNGFFIRRELIEKTDLDNYYHIDNALEAIGKPTLLYSEIWHKTGGNIFQFFKKRYRYGLQHAFNPNRRWHLVDFRKQEDILRLAWFIFASLTLIQPLCLSVRGYLKIRDGAWFLHPVCCILTLFTYVLLVLNLGTRRLCRLLSAPMAARRA